MPNYAPQSRDAGHPGAKHQFSVEKLNWKTLKKYPQNTSNPQHKDSYSRQVSEIDEYTYYARVLYGRTYGWLQREIT